MISIGRPADARERHTSRVQTPLQRLIADYLRDHPDESYSSIARRGSTPEKELPRGTVQAIAKRDSYSRQLPREDTLEALARGMQMSVERVRAAAGYATAATGDNPEVQLLLATVRDLDPERLEMVLRRARLLHEEMEEERRARKPPQPRNGRNGGRNGA